MLIVQEKYKQKQFKKEKIIFKFFLMRQYFKEEDYDWRNIIGNSRGSLRTRYITDFQRIHFYAERLRRSSFFRFKITSSKFLKPIAKGSNIYNTTPQMIQISSIVLFTVTIFKVISIKCRKCILLYILNGFKNFLIMVRFNVQRIRCSLSLSHAR